MGWVVSTPASGESHRFFQLGFSQAVVRSADRTRRFTRNLAGPVGSGQEVFETARVGLGRWVRGFSSTTRGVESP